MAFRNGIGQFAVFKKIVFLFLIITTNLLSMETTYKSRGCLNQLKHTLFVFFESAGQESLHRYSHIHRQQLIAIPDAKQNQINNNLKKRS